MSNLFKYTKRVLTSVLAAAVVLTAIPSTAFGAELPDEDFVEAVEVQEAEVADEAVVEEETAATDGTGNEEAEIIGEEDGPDTTADDTKFAIVADADDAAKHDHFDVFLNVDGDTAGTALATGKYTTLTNAKTFATNPQMLDSENGVSFYVAPKAGYEVLSTNLATAITVIGEYKANGATENTPIPTSDYSIALNTVSGIKVTGNTNDFDRAYVVTIKPGAWLTAYKRAQNNITDAGTVEKILKVMIDDDSFTARKAPISIVGGKAGVAPLEVLSTEDNTKDRDLTAHLANLTKPEIKSIVFKKTGSEDVELVENKTGYNDTTDGKNMKGTDLAYYYDSSNKLLYLGKGTIAAVFGKYSDYTLTVTVGEEEEPETATIKSDGNTLVEFIGLKKVANGSNEKAEADYEVTIGDGSTGSASQKAYAKNVMYPFLAKVKNTSATTGRKISQVYYSVDGSAPVKAAKLDITSTASSYLLPPYSGTAGYAFDGTDNTFGTWKQLAGNEGAYWAIPKTVFASAETIVLSADTTETVEYTFAEWNTGSGNKPFVTVTDGDGYANTVASAVSGPDVSSGIKKDVKTGSAYSFKVIGDATHNVKTISAEIKGVSGSSTTPVTLTKNGSVYTAVLTNGVTGILSISIATEAAEETGHANVKMTDVLTATGTDFKTGKALSTSDLKFATIGEHYKFSLTPVASGSKYIEKVEYKIGEGSFTEIPAANMTRNLDGSVDCEIPENTTSSIEIAVTGTNGTRFVKTANPDVTLTVNGKELADGKTILVKSGTDVTIGVTTASGVEYKGLYRSGLQNSAPTSSSGSTLMNPTTEGGKNYTLGASLVVNTTTDTNIYLSAETAKAVTSGFTATFTSTATGKPITALSLYCCDNVATADVHGIIDDTVTAVLKDNTTKLAFNGDTGSTWSLVQPTPAVVGFATPSTAATKIKSTDLAGNNTIKYAYVEGFPQGKSYEATLPVTTKPLNTLFTRFEFNPIVSATSTPVVNGKNIATELIATNTAIRKKTSSYDDNATFSIIAYTADPAAGDDIRHFIGGASGGFNFKSDAFITGITWKCDPEVNPATAITTDYTLTPNDSNATAVISNANKAQDLNMSAELTFADGTKATVTDGGDLKVIDETLGYVAVPTVTMNGKTEIATAAVDLGINNTYFKNATVEWMVFKQLDDTNIASNWWKTKGGIDTELENDRIALVESDGVIFDDPDITNNTNGYVTVSGTGEVRITAAKATPTGTSVSVAPTLTVDGCPVDAIATADFNVFANLPSYTVTIATGDQTGKVGVAATVPTNIDAIADYQYPALTTDFSSIGKVSKIASVGPNPYPSTAGTAAEKIVGLSISGVAAGTTLTLPTESAFTAGTFNPKKALVGYRVNTTTYKKPGETVTITGTTTIEPIWAFKYTKTAPSAGLVQGDGIVGIYKKVGTEWADVSAIGTGTINVSYGAAPVSVAVGYYALKAAGSNFDTDSGKAVYDDTLTTRVDGLTFTPETGTNTTVTKSASEVTVAAKYTSLSDTYALSWKDANNGNVEFSTFSGSKTAKTDELESAALTVAGAAEASYTVVANPNSTDATVSDPVTDLGVNVTREITLSVKDASSSAVTKRNAFSAVDVEVADKTKVGFEWSVSDATADGSLNKFKLTGKAPGSTTVKITVTDNYNNKATGTLNVTVINSPVGITATLVNSITGDAGTVIPAGGEAKLLAGYANDNDIYLSLSNGKETAASDWKTEVSDVTTAGDTDVKAWNANTALTVSTALSGNPFNYPYISDVPSATLGRKIITAVYTDPTTKDEYRREIPVRTFFAVGFNGAKSTNSLSYKGESKKESEVFVVSKGSTAIETDNVSYVEVPYVDGQATGGVYSGNYTASLKGYSASLVDTTDASWLYKGWKVGTAITTAGLNASDYEADGEIAVPATGATSWASLATNGVVGLCAVFGPQDDAFEFAGLTKINGEDAIELDDSELSTTTKAGSDNAGITIDVTPYGSNTVLYVSGTNKGMLNFTKDATVVTGATATGYAPGSEYGGVATALAKGVSGKSRTDKFAVAKVYNAAGTSKNNVGKTKLLVKNDNTSTADTVKEITVYLNGEFKDTSVTPNVWRYMYRGEVLQNGIATVAGEDHFYSEGIRVDDGVAEVTIEGKTQKVLVIGGAWYKTAGRKTYDGNTYYIDKDGFLLTKQLYTDPDEKVQYYINSDGVRVTYAMTEAQGTPGKYTDPETKVTYVIDKGTNAAEEDDKKIVDKVSAFAWNPEKNKDYNHNTSKVTATVTVDFHLEKAGTKDTATLDAAVDKDNVASVGNKDVYKATVTAAGYYTKDGKAEYDWSKVTATKTYTYDPSSGQGTGEGLEISGIESSYEYTGKAIKPEPTVTDAATGNVLVKGTDFTVSYGKNKEPGEKAGTVIVKGKGNYGLDTKATVVAYFDIVDPRAGETVTDYFTIKSVKVTSKDGFTYNGEEKFPATLTIKTDAGDVTATWSGSSYDLSSTDKDIHISVSNNINKGSGLVAVTGNNGKGAWVTKTATFSIKACDLSTAGDNLNVDAGSAEWTVKGAKAPVEVTFMSEKLVEGRDYTLSWSYSNKKNAGTGAGKVTVKGKNNFTKSVDATFDITALPIEKVDSVNVYAGMKASAIKVTMYDGEGSVIPAKNYSATFEVFSKEGLKITDSRYKLQAGDKVNVTVKAATANLDGDETLEDVVVGANLAKAKITVPKTFTKTYTGDKITLDSDDFGSGKIQVGSYEFGHDFIIVDYQNNVKKGTMTVFIQGVSDNVSGVSKFKVKIVPKNIKPEN